MNSDKTSHIVPKLSAESLRGQRFPTKRAVWMLIIVNFALAPFHWFASTDLSNALLLANGAYLILSLLLTFFSASPVGERLRILAWIFGASTWNLLSSRQLIIQPRLDLIFD